MAIFVALQRMGKAFICLADRRHLQRFQAGSLCVVRLSRAKAVRQGLKASLPLQIAAAPVAAGRRTI